LPELTAQEVLDRGMLDSSEIADVKNKNVYPVDLSKKQMVYSCHAGLYC
jgi:hypothetical protein